MLNLSENLVQLSILILCTENVQKGISDLYNLFIPRGKKSKANVSWIIFDIALCWLVMDTTTTLLNHFLLETDF